MYSTAMGKSCFPWSPPSVAAIKAGDVLRWSRKITNSDIRRFAELSEDQGAHHLEADAQGRLMAHGLLIASIPTKLGGDVNFIARSMHFDFLKPAYSGETLECTGTVETALRKPGRTKVRFLFKVTNENGDLVMKGVSAGVVYDQEPKHA